MKKYLMKKYLEDIDISDVEIVHTGDIDATEYIRKKIIEYLKKESLHRD